ncbi:Polycomb group RING finger protein 3 [Taenia crassiceps]|uniref:Polycomb group RING finger protein 3 n=1 Tax=Taenia crassiceps TaxID=6207 RepID=A0ABR4QPX7_9CEST
MSSIRSSPGKMWPLNFRIGCCEIKSGLGCRRWLFRCVGLPRFGWMGRLLAVVVAGVGLSERKSRSDFYRSIGQSPPPSEDLIYEHKTLSISDVVDGSAKSTQTNLPPADPNFHRNDEQVHVKLEPGSATLKPLNLKYLRISSKATVTHLRKYIAQQVLNDMSKFNEIDIFINNCEKGTFLGRDHVLKFVRVVYWNDDRPMPLEYRFSTKFL